MSEFVEVNTAELVGPALDWAMAMTDGWKSDRPQDGQVWKNGVFRIVGPRPISSTLSPDWFYSPSTDWEQGGPLIGQYQIELLPSHGPGILKRWYAFFQPSSRKYMKGDTALVAICRAIVAAKLGNVVQVPAELVEVTA